MNYFGFGANFISGWIRIRFRIWNADPDPGDKFNPDTDPDPKHWRQGRSNRHETCFEDQKRLAKSKGLLGTRPTKNKKWKPL
jgi:hypothetical protein